MIKKSHLYILFIAFCLTLLSSCGSSKSSALLYDPKEVAYLSDLLDIEISNINKSDDRHMPLYAEVSTWLGTPYRYGGTTRKGTDCSGFTMQVYKKLYNKKLPRSASGMGKAKYKKVSKSKLDTGDIVMFATGKNKKTISHVGIYLKDGKFIHASTSNGVIVSHLNEEYYKKRWIKAVRIN